MRRCSVWRIRPEWSSRIESERSSTTTPVEPVSSSHGRADRDRAGRPRRRAGRPRPPRCPSETAVRSAGPRSARASRLSTVRDGLPTPPTGLLRRAAAAAALPLSGGARPRASAAPLERRPHRSARPLVASGGGRVSATRREAGPPARGRRRRRAGRAPPRRLERTPLVGGPVRPRGILEQLECLLERRQREPPGSIGSGSGAASRAANRRTPARRPRGRARARRPSSSAMSTFGEARYDGSGNDATSPRHGLGPAARSPGPMRVLTISRARTRRGRPRRCAGECYPNSTTAGSNSNGTGCRAPAGSSTSGSAGRT